MQTCVEKHPTLPRWELRKTESKAREFYGQVLARWQDTRMDEQTLSMLVDDCAECMGFTHYDQYSALIDTLCQDLDQVLDFQRLVRMSMQLTVNRGLLLSGTPLRRFEGVSEPEWVPFFICRLVPCTFGARAGMQLHLRVVAGQYAGFKAERSVPIGFLARLAYDIGFSKRLQYDQPSDLLGLTFAGLLVPTAGADLQFEDYALTSAMRAENRQIIKHMREEE